MSGQLAIPTKERLRFGHAPKPLSCGFNLTVGGGSVFPELNFTLPAMDLDESTWEGVLDQYREIGEMIVGASQRLKLPGLMIEFELLPPMTEKPQWGAEITSILLESLKEAHDKHGLPCALRVTPTDIRDFVRPPLLRTGPELEMLLESFDQCAKAGGHILSIESVGGKEVHDEALLYGDVAGIIFALGILAPRDMEFLWNHIVRIARANNAIPGGDSACGFANTAMQLTSQGMLPEVLAAMIRAASSVRSLVAFECGAVGPSKDCAYEGPILKAITGYPISMEGKSASCAHFSPIGNIAAAACDLWSNESVQNLRLLSGSAPEAYLELLAYDCRLFNRSLEKGNDRELQALLVESDAHLSPQALVLTPEATVRIANTIVAQKSKYHQTLAAAREAVAYMKAASEQKFIDLSSQELKWLGKLESALNELPDNETNLLTTMVDTYGHLFSPKSYGLS